MSAIQTTINGVVAFADSSLNIRLLDVKGLDVPKYVMKPGDNFDATYGQFTQTIVGSSTFSAPTGVVENVGKIITGANGYDGASNQLKGETFQFENGKPMYFGIKFTASEATQSDLLFGLLKTNTAPLKTSSSHGINSTIEGAFFYKIAGTTALYGATYVANAATNVTTSPAVFTTSATICEFYWDGTTLAMYVNGTLLGTFTGSMPTVPLTPTFEMRAGSGGAVNCTIQWARAFEIRG